jgi:hypothetical protein
MSTRSCEHGTQSFHHISFGTLPHLVGLSASVMPFYICAKRDRQIEEQPTLAIHLRPS